MVKEFLEDPDKSGILVANLTATDPEEADILGHGFVTSALTMAEEDIPMALAVYDQEKVLAVTKLLSPREAVKRTLMLAGEITLINPSERFLDPQEVKRLRRTIALLDTVDTEPARRLSDILKMEYTAMDLAAKEHPLSTILTETMRHVPPPATMTVVSPWNHDIDALSVMLEKVQRKGYSVVQVPVTSRQPQGILTGREFASPTL